MVTARFAPFMGGVETHTYEVSRRLAASGVEVRVVTTDPSGALPRSEIIDGIRVDRLAAWPARGDLYFAPGLARRITREAGGIVHVQGFHTLVAPLAMAAAAARGIPYVVTFHSGGHSSSIRNAIRPVQTAVLGPLLRRASRLIAVSDFEANVFSARLRLPPDRIEVIPNGAELLPRELDVSVDREPLIVSLGRLERYKGHHRVIAALPTVARAIPQVRLMIIGSGPYEAALRHAARQAGVAERVEIRAIAREHRSELGAVLARAGLVTLLSEYESQGISVMEALAMGAPVLTSDGSALGDLGRKGMVRTVSLAATDVDIGRAMVNAVQQGSDAVFDLPTWDDAARRLLETYTRILDRR